VVHIDPAHHPATAVDEDHVVHAGVGLADPRHHAHPLGDLDSWAADVDGAAAGPQFAGLLNDRDLKTRFCQPVRGGRPGNACPGDQRLAHIGSLIAVSAKLQQVRKYLRSR